MSSRPRAATRPLAFGLALSAVAFFAAMALTFGHAGLPLWRQYGWTIFTSGEWFYRDGVFGVLGMLYGTLAVSAIALALALPLGLGTALFTSEWLPSRLRFPFKSLVELLAGIPSVVYGLLGVLLLRGWMERVLAPFDPVSGDTLATGGVLLAVMVLPTLMTLADDALAGVPTARREAARALGLTRTETVLHVSLPGAFPGIAAAALLALGRALGETVAVFLVVGRLDGQLPERLLSAAPLADAGQTVTSKLAGSEVFLAWGDPVHWGALMTLGLLLLGTTTLVTMAGLTLARRSVRSSSFRTFRAPVPRGDDA